MPVMEKKTDFIKQTLLLLLFVATLSVLGDYNEHLICLFQLLQFCLSDL